MPEPAAPTDEAPGLLIAVVGPSGAGKDTLIERSKAAFATAPVHYPLRCVTRPSSAAERHDSLSPEDFARAEADGQFALTWQAHGLSYAIPAWIDAVLAAGETVVCNVSRGIVPVLRQRYRRVCVIYVDAPLDVRLARIASRGGRADKPDRARRQQDLEPGDADAIVDNGASVEDATEAFVAAIRAARLGVVIDPSRPDRSDAP